MTATSLLLTARASRSLIDVRVAVLIVAATAAAFLRFYDLQPFAWFPDHYDRLIDAERIAAGQLPRSPTYPPGFALLLAPAAVFVDASPLLIQVVTGGLGVALVGLVYWGAIKATGDSLTAALLAVACAVSPLLVQMSRAGQVDAVIVFFAFLAVVLVPTLRGKSMAHVCAYALLLALLINLRVSNAALLPCLVVYWGATNPTGWRRALMAKELLAVGGIASALCIASVLLSDWYTASTGEALELSRLPGNLLRNWQYALHTSLGVALLLPLAVSGAWRLRATHRPLLLAIITLLLIWPLAHSPFPFANPRYMAPPALFLLLLAAHGVAGVWGVVDGYKRPLRYFRAWALASGVLAGVVLMAGSVIVLASWPTVAAESDEGMVRETGPALRALDSGSLVVTAVAGAFALDGDDIEYLDLFQQSVELGMAEASIGVTTAAIAEALAQGRDVFYLWTQMEVRKDGCCPLFDGYYRYFDAVQTEFSLSETFRSSHGRSGATHWVLYRLTAPSEGASDARPEP